MCSPSPFSLAQCSASTFSSVCPRLRLFPNLHLPPYSAYISAKNAEQRRERTTTLPQTIPPRSAFKMLWEAWFTIQEMTVGDNFYMTAVAFMILVKQRLWILPCFFPTFMELTRAVLMLFLCLAVVLRAISSLHSIFGLARRVADVILNCFVLAGVCYLALWFLILWFPCFFFQDALLDLPLPGIFRHLRHAPPRPVML